MLITKLLLILCDLERVRLGRRTAPRGWIAMRIVLRSMVWVMPVMLCAGIANLPSPILQRTHS